MDDTADQESKRDHFGGFVPTLAHIEDERAVPIIGDDGKNPGGDHQQLGPEAWTTEVGFTVKRHWRQKPALLKMKETPKCIRNLSRINKIYFEEAVVQREKPKTVCAVTDSREAIHFTAERIRTEKLNEDGDEDEDEIRVLLKDPRNNPVLEMKITDVKRLYFTRRCTRAVINYASEEGLVFTFKEISSNVLVSTRYVYRIYRGIINDEDSDEEEGNDEDNNNRDEEHDQGERDEKKLRKKNKKVLEQNEVMQEEEKEKQKRDDEEEDDEEDGYDQPADGKPRELVEIQRHGFMSCARAGGSVELIYRDGSSETAEISDTDHDCFRIHYRLVLGFPRSADPVTKALLIAGMILSSPRILRYVADL